MPPQRQWLEPVSYGSDDDDNMNIRSGSPTTTTPQVIESPELLRRPVGLSRIGDEPGAVDRWLMEPTSSSFSSSSNLTASYKFETSPNTRKRRIRKRRTELSLRSSIALLGSFVIVVTLYYEGLSWTFGEPSEPVSSQPKLEEPSNLLNSQSVGDIPLNDRRIIGPHGSPDEVIHIVHTRFMQNQPSLIELGLARLELLRDFTLQSLQDQSSSNFLWVIRTDPALDSTLKEPLLALLNGMDNHLLVATNDNPNVQIGSILSSDPSSIWSGDLITAQEYLKTESTKPSRVLESRLDSDDAVHYQFIEYLQIHAIWDLPEERAQWKIWCASQHFEWQFHTVSDQIAREPGMLLAMKDQGCISAGLTIGYTDGLSVHELPPIKHQNLGHIVPSCKKQKLPCLDYITLLPTALRARTPTSAGMLNVLLGSHEKVDKKYHQGAIDQEKYQDQIWNLAFPRFGFTRQQASHLRTYLTNHLAGIAQDNLIGQCSLGHSCKNSSKALLQAIIADPAAFA